MLKLCRWLLDCGLSAAPLAGRQSRRAGLRKRVSLAYSSLRSSLPLQFCKRSLAPRFTKLEKNYNH
jgi:hypothetical protein